MGTGSVPDIPVWFLVFGSLNVTHLTCIMFSAGISHVFSSNLESNTTLDL